jgi:hypothetical protein
MRKHDVGERPRLHRATFPQLRVRLRHLRVALAVRPTNPWPGRFPTPIDERRGCRTTVHTMMVTPLQRLGLA